MAQIAIFSTSVAYKMIKGFLFLDVMIKWESDQIKVAFKKNNNVLFFSYHNQRINLAGSIIHKHQPEMYTGKA